MMIIITTNYIFHNIKNKTEIPYDHRYPNGH